MMNPRELWKDVLEHAHRLAEASSASLCLLDVDEGVLEIEVAVGLPEDVSSRCRLPLGRGVTGWVARHGKTLVVPDVDADERYVPVRAGVRSELAVPVVSENAVIGVINLDSDRPSAFDAETVDVIEMLARRCADAVGFSRLYQAATGKNRSLERLVHLSGDLNRRHEEEDVARAVVDGAIAVLDAAGAVLLRVREGRFERIAATGAVPEHRFPDGTDLDALLVERALARGLPLAVDDLGGDPTLRSYHVPGEALRRGALCVLIEATDGPVGALVVYAERPRHFRGYERSIAALLAQRAAAAIENAQLFDEVRRTGRRLRQSEKLEALGTLAAGLAHELRNPLNTMSVLVFAMAERAGRGDVRIEDVAVVQNELERMSRLVDQMLRYARPAPPEFRREHLEPIVEEAVALVRPEAEKRSIRLVHEPNGATDAVWADAGQLRQVVLNLLLNALQANERDGGVVLRLANATGGVALSVEDDGAGITEEARCRLFEPFFTQRPGGTGLGLPISLRIVEAHGGRLVLEPAEERGTVATMWLPS